MKTLKVVVLVGSHLMFGAVGFGLGIYALPILIEPPSPSTAEIAQMEKENLFKTRFEKDLEGSDALHWGEGDVALNASSITFIGELSPGPDYRLYLVPEFVETEAQFEAVKAQSKQVGMIATFTNFVVPLDSQVNLEEYTTVVVWCERFGEFITAAKYR